MEMERDGERKGDSPTHTPAEEPPPPASGPSPIRCCCGSPRCVVLRHNCSVLEGVEKDVHMAAKLGQALLVRHEAFMADASRDRAELTARIAYLEAEKVRLEALNARVESDNRSLAEQLDVVNTGVASSDDRVHALEASLQASQQSVRRLEIAASRAADMEKHIAGLEFELESAQDSMFATEEEARSTARRWRAAERIVAELQDQLEQMERAASEERERQAEVIARMERQRELERELSSAAGRLKGAAAAARSFGVAAGGPHEKPGAAAVSSFVRDLLRDNASLQLGIAELRELLASSREEIQTLRDCLAGHQPMADDTIAVAASTLRAELGIPQSPPQLQQPPAPSGETSRAVHIHHHYHAAPKAESRKPRKRRPGVISSLFVPTPSTPSLSSVSSRSTTTTADDGWLPSSRPPSAAPTSSQDFYYSARVGGPAAAADLDLGTDRQLWSPGLAEFESSLASSPLSNARGSVFDRSPDATSEPLSPTTSVDGLSPQWRGGKRVTGSVPPSPSVRAALRDSPAAAARSRGHQLRGDADDESAWDDPTPTARGRSPASPAYSAGRLRRTASHESVISVGGADIHTLKARPSQITLHQLGGAQAILTDITAQPTISRGGTGARGSSSSILRSSLAAAAATQPSPSASASDRDSAASNQRASFRWAWRPWRASDGTLGPCDSESGGPSEETTTAASSSETAVPEVLLPPGDPATDSPPAATDSPLPKGQSPAAMQRQSVASSTRSSATWDGLRAPGINQPGAIPGFSEFLAQAKRRVPSRVVPERVDWEALGDVLEQ